jgi:hypothetical protein
MLKEMMPMINIPQRINITMDIEERDMGSEENQENLTTHMIDIAVLDTVEK